LSIAADASLALASAPAVALALLWTGLPPARSLAAGAIAFVFVSIAIVLGAGQSAFGAVAGACVLLIAYAAVKHRDPVVVRYRSALSLSIGIVLMAEAASPGGALPSFARLLPVAITFAYIARQCLFGLLISKRFLLLNVLAGISAFYLLIVRVFGNFAELEFGWFAGAFEIIMISLAAIMWVPLYGWMFRSLTARTERYRAFNQRTIQEAVRILELEQRGHFLVNQMTEQYKLKRAVLYSLSDGRHWTGGADGHWLPFERQLDVIVAGLHDAKPGPLHVLRTADTAVRKVLAEAGLTYVFPLWYDETHLTGLLLVDSSPRWYLDDLEPVLAAFTAQVAHSLESCRLVEEKIGLEKTLVRQEHLATLGKIAATIAHEVKNPLSSIKTLAQLMREDEEVNRQYEQDLRFIIGETDRLNSCVQQLLTFSRPAPQGAAEISLTDLLRDVAKAIGRDYENQRIGLKLEVEPDLRLTGADMQSIQQIVMNLTLNAMQASSPGDFVKLEARRESGGQIRFAVTDQGPGIPAELREKIFEPFFTTKQKGTGLGLAIVRKNVRHLEGNLQVVSPVDNGKGTSILVTLPAQVGPS
jgi:signal transduction histidine kinase